MLNIIVNQKTILNLDLDKSTKELYKKSRVNKGVNVSMFVIDKHMNKYFIELIMCDLEKLILSTFVHDKDSQILKNIYFIIPIPVIKGVGK